MGRLRHRTSPGSTYFVTTKTWENRELFRLPENANILIECLLSYRDRGAYALHEFVVMPNHLHILLTPSTETSLEKAMQLIKGGSSHEIHSRRGHKMQIWQPGFHESTVRDSRDFEMRRRYIHMNPVEAHLVDRAADWPYGSPSGTFKLDAVLARLSSGAQAPSAAAELSELKLRPPEQLLGQPEAKSKVFKNQKALSRPDLKSISSKDNPSVKHPWRSGKQL